MQERVDDELEKNLLTTWNSSKSTGLEEYTHCAGEFTIHHR